MSSSTPPLSDSELKKYQGKKFDEAANELESKGYTIMGAKTSDPPVFGEKPPHKIMATGLIPSTALDKDGNPIQRSAPQEQQEPQPNQHWAKLYYDGNDPEKKIYYIEQFYR